MNVIYSTTKPRWSDTRAITKGKWLQSMRDGASDGGESQVITYPDTENRFHDTDHITLQKILQHENS
jgi:hypothetical protein